LASILVNSQLCVVFQTDEKKENRCFIILDPCMRLKVTGA